MLAIVQPTGYSLLATGAHLRMLKEGCPACLDMVDAAAGVLLMILKKEEKLSLLSPHPRNRVPWRPRAGMSFFIFLQL